MGGSVADQARRDIFNAINQQLDGCGRDYFHFANDDEQESGDIKVKAESSDGKNEKQDKQEL